MIRILTVILIAFVLVSCDSYRWGGRNTEFVIGERYLLSYNWNTDNPFDKTEKDTIIILDIKDGYVKWRKDTWNIGRYHSNKQLFLNKITRNIT